MIRWKELLASKLRGRVVLTFDGQEIKPVVGRSAAMRALLLAVAVLAAGCGGPTPCPADYTTLRGVSVCLGGATLAPETADAMEEWTIQSLSSNFPEWYPEKKTRECVAQMWVQIHNAPTFQLRDSPIELTGISNRNFADVAFGNPCPWKSAYRHELAHWVQLCARGIVDAGHRTREWRIIDGALDPEVCTPGVVRR